MNFDPNMMNPGMMKNFMESLSGMSDDEITKMMNSMGMPLDPKMVRQFADQMKNASDDDFEKMKNQYTGNFNMQDELNKMPPELKKIRELDEKFMKLLEESKYVEAIDVCLAIQSEMPNIPENEKTGEKKQFFDELEDDIRDRIVHCKLKLEDYDSAIENALNFLEIRETYGIHSKLGICYFKKGRYYKARDHFNKAKNLNPNFEDKIVDNYLKQTIEMIADIEN